MQEELFDYSSLFHPDQNPLDDTQITTTLLYYSEQELKEFKSCAKILMRKYWGSNYKDADISTLILKLFKNECKAIETGQNNDQQTS